MRNATSTEWLRASTTSVGVRPGGGSTTGWSDGSAPAAAPAFLIRYARTSTTSDQPTPMSSWLAPVMLASARGANSFGLVPAFDVNTKSTAYSGRTAISGNNATDSPAELWQ